MKIVKMSLVAAVLIGSSAFAIENTQISGNANVLYSTSDAKGQTSNVIKGENGSGTLFDKDSSAADIGLNLNVTTDLLKNDLVSVSAGAGYTVLSTLGLENNFVSNVWGSAHGATGATKAGYATEQASPFGGAKVENANWFNEAWVAVSTGKTTAKLGRMELDTPLAFTEKWSIERNTFEAAVVINQDLPDTTLVGAFVGNGNGTETFGQNINGTVVAHNLGVAPLVNEDGKFTTYGTDGAYAAGLVNNSFKPLTFQAWYYDVSRFAQAYWLQADIKCSLVDGVLLGGQYTGITIDKNIAVMADGSEMSSDAYAVMLGYEMKDVATAKVSYSEVGKDHSAGFNTATAAGTAQSKLYTETWWNYGHITAADTSAVNVTVTSPVQGMVDLGLYVTMVDHQPKNTDLTEITLTAGKTFGPLSTTLAYINTDSDVDGADSSIIQAYLTVNF